VTLARNSGGIAPKRPGGDQRSARIEAHAPLILGMVEKTPDVTLGELRAALAEQGIGAGIATLWRFFARRRITLKKRLRMPASKIAPTS
jgi:transposase